MPTTVVRQIGTGPGADYSSIAAWEADTDNDLVSLDRVEVGALQGQDHSNVAVTIFGATEDATRFRRLTAMPGAEALGRTVESSGAGIARVIGAATGATFLVLDQHFDIDGFEIAYGGGQDSNANAIRYATQSAGAEHLAHDLVVHNVNGVGKGTNSNGIAGVDADAVLHIYRNIVFGFDLTGIYLTGASGSTCHHNTVFKCNRGANASFGGIMVVSAGFAVENNLSLGCGVNDYKNLSTAGTHAKNASSDATGDTGFQNRVITTDTQYATDTLSFIDDTTRNGTLKQESGPAYEWLPALIPTTSMTAKSITASSTSWAGIAYFDTSGIASDWLIVDATIKYGWASSAPSISFAPRYMESLVAGTDANSTVHAQAVSGSKLAAPSFNTNGNPGATAVTLNAAALSDLIDRAAAGDDFGLAIYYSGSPPASNTQTFNAVTLTVTYWSGEKFGNLYLQPTSSLIDEGENTSLPPYGIRGNSVGIPDIGADEADNDKRLFRTGPRPHHYRPAEYRPAEYRPTIV